MLDTIRTIIAEHGGLSAPIDTLSRDQDLYAAGLSSLAAVRLMLAFESRFGVAFPESMLNRRSFASIDAIAGCLHRLVEAEAV